jgi:16S rRNA (guanine527-N7)-methyltransferase
MSAADELRRVLEDARAAGFLGPGPVDAHLRHAEGFAELAEAVCEGPPARFVDLGTGGGVPGLVLAAAWPDARAAFVESNRRRGEALRWAVVRIGLEDRAEVLEARAEEVARDPGYREGFDLVSARSFAAPAATAEIAAGLVVVGGVVVVSDPPDSDPDRWPAAGLAQLGFEAADHRMAAEAHFVVLRKVAAVDGRFPRATGRPAKRPLW